MDDTIVGLFPVGETVVVLVDRVKAAPKRWYSHLLLSSLILFDGCNHAVAFTLVGKKIPHVALSGERRTFPTLLGHGPYPRRVPL